ncbi:MAG: hypothetical protein GC182_08515 [Rhodopseudomonas sp.]|nr:hypothetical protein [Rhodopseudomonas sp.]
MVEELVTVLAAGERFTGFTSVEVDRKFTHAAGSFHLHIAAEAGAFATAAKFVAGTEIDILFNGDLALRAFVDRYKPKITRHKRAEINISGRSRGQDFIDSAAMHDTGEFIGKSPLDIAKALDKFGVGITSDLNLDKINWRVTPGELAHRAVEKICRSQGAWMSGQADGSIAITTAGRGRNGALIEGKNILDAEGDHNWANRHSHVIVRGQGALGHGAAVTQIEAMARDASLGRYRPIVVIQDDDTDKGRAQKRADHRRDSEVGNSLRAHIVTQGFHDDAGVLWQPGFLTYSEIPFLGIAQDMAIEAVKCRQDRHSGSLTMLSLVDPLALGAKKSRKGGKTAGAWKSDAGQTD